MPLKVALWIRAFLLMQGMKHLIGKQGWQLAWECGPEAITVHPMTEGPNIIVIEGADWLTCARYVREKNQVVPILLVTAAKGVLQDQLDLLGVRGVVPFSVTENVLSVAIQTVALKNVFIHPEIEVSALSGQQDLTAREMEILQLLANGTSIKDTAAKLNLAVKTVESHKVNIMRKLGIHNRAALTAHAYRHGLVEV